MSSDDEDEMSYEENEEQEAEEFDGLDLEWVESERGKPKVGFFIAMMLTLSYRLSFR